MHTDGTDIQTEIQIWFFASGCMAAGPRRELYVSLYVAFEFFQILINVCLRLRVKDVDNLLLHKNYSNARCAYC